MRITKMNRILILAALLVVVCFTATADRRRASLLVNPPASAAACATADTTLPHDELLEGWTGASQENTWTSAGGEAGVTIDLNADSSALTAGKPTGACNEAAQFTIVSATGTETYYRWDRGSTIATNVDLNTRLYLYVTTAPLTGQSMQIVYFGAFTAPTSGGGRVRLNLSDVSGQMKLSASGTTVTSTTGANGNISMDTWIKVEILCAGTDPTTSSLVIDGGTPLGFTSALNLSRYFCVGPGANLETADVATFYLDVIAVDTP